MAKQCIYCGHLLAKDDARFCNDCGRLQVSQARASSGAASPSAIKVKLPPREFARDDPSPAQPENSLPGRAVNPPPQREQANPPSARLPKRPARLSPPDAPAPVDKEMLAEDEHAAMLRLADSVQAAEPTPAEEISTMVLPNWREELAQLRKEQEQAGAVFPKTPEKKIERPTPEPPPLARRPPGSPLSPIPPVRESSSQTSQPRAPEKALPAAASHSSAPLESTHPAEPLDRLPEKTASTPEDRRGAQESRREPETVAPFSQTQEERPQPRPAPAVEKNPFANVDFALEEPVLDIEDRETIHWPTPSSAMLAQSGRPATSEERSSATGNEQPSLIEERRFSVQEDQPDGEERQPTGRAEAQADDDWSSTEEKKDDIEDLPTARLAVPEAIKQEAQIKVERASTPAPKKWATSPADEVEDLPTRPLTAASPLAGFTAAHSPQGGERYPETNQGDFSEPFPQRTAHPFSSPGAYGSSPAALEQIAEAPTDTFAAYTRPASPSGQPGAAGNIQSRPETPNPQGVQPFPATPIPDAPTQAATSSPTAQAGVTSATLPREKKRAGRVLATALILLVLLGGGTGAVLNWSWIAQFFAPAAANQPYQTYQNSALGVVLDYTQGWNVNVDQAHSAVHFADSSRTGQINLTMAAASGQVGDYLKQQETQQTVNGPKTVPSVAFAGASWQRVQGSVVQSGATYTIVLYATQHNNHFYLLAFLAPQATFTSADQSNFAHVRSSFKFI